MTLIISIILHLEQLRGKALKSSIIPYLSVLIANNNIHSIFCRLWTGCCYKVRMQVFKFLYPSAVSVFHTGKKRIKG